MSSPRIPQSTTKRVNKVLAARLSTQADTNDNNTDSYDISKKHKVQAANEQKLNVATTLKYVYSPDYWELQILPSYDQWSVNNPSKIVSFDIDETLIDFKQSEKLGNLVFINPEALKNLMSYIEHDIMVVAVTSRNIDSSNVKANHFLSAIEVIKAVEKLCGRQIFSAIFFTEGRAKSPVLNELYNRHVKASSHPSRNKMVILDDLDFNLEDCSRAGYRTIKADYQGTHFYSAVDDFLLSPIPELENEDNSFICEESLDNEENLQPPLPISNKRS